MKLTVIDGHTMNPGDLSWKQYEQFGQLQVFEHSTEDEDEVIRRIGDAEIVIANKSKVTRRVIDACPNIRYIAVQATGYDPIDYVYAREKGIPVSNVPAYGTASVAQFAIALLLELCGHVGHHDQAVHQGKWAECGDWCFWDYPMIELAGKTMGIIGFGRIGQAVGRIAHGIGMDVSSFSPLNRPQKIIDAGYHVHESREALFLYNDIVSLHIPATPTAVRSIGYDLVKSMKPNAILVNSARKEVIDEAGLLRAMEERPDLRYVTDLKLDAHDEAVEKLGNRYMFTPKKMGAQTAEANINAGLAAAQQIVEFFRDGVHTFQVNK